MINARLHFSKTFDARYISHLDLTRTFTRAIKHAGIDVWYTEGFNEHIYLTFALPLSLGYESICETCDIRLNGDTVDPDICAKINSGLPFGIEVFDCAPAKYKPGDIAYARYMIELADPGIPAAAIAAALEELLASPSIPVRKRTKSGGTREVELKDWIDTFEVLIKDDCCYLNIVGTAESERSFNPALLLGVLFEKLGRETDHQLVKRTQILTKDRKNFE